MSRAELVPGLRREDEEGGRTESGECVRALGAHLLGGPTGEDWVLKPSPLQRRAQLVQPLQKLCGLGWDINEPSVHILKSGPLHQLLFVDHP